MSEPRRRMFARRLAAAHPTRDLRLRSRARVVDLQFVDPILHLSLPVDDLDTARTFYVDMWGCTPGQRVEGGLDVWFYGLQLTLQLRPDDVLPASQQGCRHFGVTLHRAALDELLLRLEQFPIRWVTPISTDVDGRLRGKTGAKIADPSGNVIELKSYDDPKLALGQP